MWPDGGRCDLDQLVVANAFEGVFEAYVGELLVDKLCQCLPDLAPTQSRECGGEWFAGGYPLHARLGTLVGMERQWPS